ncbi:hypothetical protein [Bdellovibrio sp. HCB337]|uniref:hypothetical protein n=1 Tax=Bdellovibrio sp. HCB337 TaxID=3394358 RepID=UPI0039A4F7F9
MTVIKMFLLYVFSVYAIDIPDRGFGESTENPEKFPAKAFSFDVCSESIPVKKGKNPWLLIEKKKTKQAPMDPNPPSWVESYYVNPSNKSKQFAIHNQADSIYSSPTTLARIDCKDGLIYFQHLVREPAPTNFYRVYDLISGTEYKVTEGAVTISPDGKHLMTASASDRDQKCGRSGSCEVSLHFYSCKGRKSKHVECTHEHELNYSVTSKTGKAASFAPVPVKWKEPRKNGEELKVILGGSKRSPATITCEVRSGFSCRVSKSKNLEFSKKGPS